jgi:O-antigen ligase
VASLVPVVFSLNRTLWLCLIVLLVYGGARFAIRGRKGNFQAICAVAIVGYVLFNFGPTGQLISDRAQTNHSGSGRALLYNEAADSVKKSPLLGYGAPRASQRNPNLPPVGTQGHFWLVFFSHGFPGAILFVSFIVSSMWRTRRVQTNAGLWCHMTLLLAIIMMPFYGLFHMQIHVVAIAFALASRERVDPDVPTEPEALPEPKSRAYVVSTVRTDRPAALTSASNGNGNGHGQVHTNGNGDGHRPGAGETPWGRGGDAPEGWS